MAIQFESHLNLISKSPDWFDFDSSRLQFWLHWFAARKGFLPIFNMQLIGHMTCREWIQDLPVYSQKSIDEKLFFRNRLLSSSNINLSESQLLYTIFKISAIN